MARIKRTNFAKIKRTAVEHYNDNNCCTIIAGALLFNVSFGKCKALAERDHGREHGRGLTEYKMVDLYMALGRLTGRTIREVDAKGKTPASFHKLNPTGEFALLVKGHVITCRNGVIEDWTGASSRRTIKKVWRVS